MSDIRAKELQARRTVDIFNKEIDKIFADAKAAGVNLSLMILLMLMVDLFVLIMIILKMI